MSETEKEKEDRTIVVNADTRSWIEKIVQAFSKKETLTAKMKVALTEGGEGCQNGDRGEIIKAVTEHDIKEKRVNNWFIIGIISLGIFGTSVMSFFFNWLNHVIGT